MADKPTLPEVLRLALEAFARDVHVAIPGKVKSYDQATQTAEVLPLVKKATPRADGGTELKNYPIIPNVRVMWPRAGGAYLHLPMTEGDYVQLVFNEAAIGHWRATGQAPSAPGDLTRHGLSYPYAYPGGWPDAEAFALPPLDSYQDRVVLRVPSILLVFNDESTPAQFVALAEHVMDRLNTIQAAFDAHVHPTGVGPSGPPPAPIGPLANVASSTLKAQ